MSEDRVGSLEQNHISLSNGSSREGDLSQANSDASYGAADEADEVQVGTEVEQRATLVSVEGSRESERTSGAALRLMNGVNEMLECPVCQDVMLPPIYQCQHGHTICSACKAKVEDRCPSCRCQLGSIRCLVLEKVASSLRLPCAFFARGCNEVVGYAQKQNHEEHCMFRPFACPYAGSPSSSTICNFSGEIAQLVSHLVELHKVDMRTGPSFIHRYVMTRPTEVENATWMPTVLGAFGSYFCLHFEAFQLGRAPVYMAYIQYMGDEADAARFSYTLEVGNGERKMTWQGVPASIRVSPRSVRDAHDGLVLQRKVALMFSGGEDSDLNLRVTGRITRAAGSR